MFIFANFLYALIHVLNLLFFWVNILLLARVVISWVNPDPYNLIVQFLYRTTEPILEPIRRRVPFAVGVIDFSPMIAMLIIFFLQSFVITSLRDVAVRLKYPAERPAYSVYE